MAQPGPNTKSHIPIAPLEPVRSGGALVPPNGLRGSHCGAAAFEALSCGRDRVRWRSRWLFRPGRSAVEPVALAGIPGAAGSLVLRRMDRRGTRGALCGPRSTAPRALVAPGAGGASLHRRGVLSHSRAGHDPGPRSGANASPKEQRAAAGDRGSLGYKGMVRKNPYLSSLVLKNS